MSSAMSSDMLQMAAKSGHSEGSQNHIQPISHSQNMDAGWNTPVFENNLELFPGAHNAKIDLGGICGSLDHDGILAPVIQNSAFKADIAGPFNGTLFALGNVGHEGFNLKLSGDTSATHSAPSAQLNVGDGLDVMGKGGGAGHGGHG